MSTGFKKIGTSVIAIWFAVGGLCTLYPYQAHAQERVEVVGGNGTIQETLSAIAEAATLAIQESLEIKEFVLDDIAFALAKLALQEIVKGTVSWINSGFNGNPAFITDLEQHLRNTADEIAGEIIYGSDLGFLCSPLELDVRVALEVQYNEDNDLGKEVECTLSDVTDNVEGFLSGDFGAGGWPGWFDIMINPQNNLVGATAIAQAKLTNEILRARQEEIAISEWGEGFLSWEECTELPSGGKDCKIQTPGSVISEQLTFSLSAGERTLIEADEINEVIGALFAQLGSQALQGAGGLLGLSGGGSDGSPSYIDRIGDPVYDPTTTGGNGGGASGSATSFIAGAITDERAYRAIQQRIVDRAVSVIVQADSCNDSVVSGATTIKNRAQENIAVSLSTEASLQAMQLRYNEASPQERLTIVEEFQRLKTTGALHDELSNFTAGREADSEIARLNSLALTIDPCPTDEPDNEGGGSER